MVIVGSSTYNLVAIFLFLFYYFKIVGVALFVKHPAPRAYSITMYLRLLGKLHMCPFEKVSLSSWEIVSVSSW